MFPTWLHLLSMAALALGFLCAGALAVDVVRLPQRMGIMNIVWPVTALFGTVMVVWAYRAFGRNVPRVMDHSNNEAGGSSTPFPIAVGKGALHCGSGCMIGDVVAEWLAFLFPVVAIWFGWQTVFAEKMFAVWILDFVFAFGLGIVFQYFAIVPMRDLSFREGMVAALKADTLSLLSWQVGMYGFMAFAQFYLYETLLGQKAAVNTPEFWFAMQIAMICGFVTAYPVNWWLIRKGLKERM